MKFFHRIRNKLIFAFFIVTLIPALAIGAYSLQASTRTLLDRELNNQTKEINTISQKVTSFLSSAKADVLFLSKTPAMINLLTNKNNENKDASSLKVALEQEFLAFSQARRIYYQIRYIDENGQEIVRIDSDGINKNSDQAESKVIPQDKLQNKLGRYYFEDALGLLPQEVFVSPLDLNREKGKVEMPLKPVIRYATPLFYPNSNQRAGIVITNIDAKGFLQGLNKTILLSEDGSYYNHPEKTKLWGSKRDLNTGHNILKDEPLVSGKLLKMRKGVITSSGENLLAYDKSTDIFSALGNLNEKVMTFTKFEVPGATPAQSWVFVASKPIGTLLSSLLSFVKTFLLILGGVLIFAFLLALIMGSAITRPIVYLTDMAEKVSMGELDKAIVVNDKGEIGHLAAAFERMRVSMVKSLERLHRRRRAA